MVSHWNFKRGNLRKVHKNITNYKNVSLSRVNHSLNINQIVKFPTDTHMHVVYRWQLVCRGITFLIWHLTRNSCGFTQNKYYSGQTFYLLLLLLCLLFGEVIYDYNYNYLEIKHLYITVNHSLVFDLWEYAQLIDHVCHSSAAFCHCQQELP